MPIDIHSILGKNPITRNVLKPKFGIDIVGLIIISINKLIIIKLQVKYIKSMINQKIKQMKFV